MDQTKCSQQAQQFFTSHGYKDSDGITFSYTNHFNSKLNKCFVLVNYYGLSTDILSMDLYDALEGKHYAGFFGHNNCYVASSLTKNPNVCQMDSGNIWFHGNDTKNPADYHVGFGGLMNGGVGNDNTQKHFLEHLQPFMNE